MNSRINFEDFAARLREFMQASESTERDDGATEFNDLALELFGLQFKNNAAYRRFCEAGGSSPDSVRTWLEIPAIPSSAFKELELSCLLANGRTAVFYSSGTSAQRPSRHFHNRASLALYEASLLSWFG